MKFNWQLFGELFFLYYNNYNVNSFRNSMSSSIWDFAGIGVADNDDTTDVADDGIADDDVGWYSVYCMI